MSPPVVSRSFMRGPPVNASLQPAGRGHEPAYWSPLIGLLVGTAFTASQIQRAPRRSHPEMEGRAMARGGGGLGREVQGCAVLVYKVLHRRS